MEPYHNKQVLDQLSRYVPAVALLEEGVALTNI